MQQLDVEGLVMKLRECPKKEQTKEVIGGLVAQEKMRLMVLWSQSFQFPDYEQNIQNLSQIAMYLTSQVNSLQWLTTQNSLLNKESINNIALTLSNSRHPDNIISVCYQLHKLKKDEGRLRQSLTFIKELLNSFQYIEKDDARQRAMLLVFELMLENGEIINYANQPYYCLQYFVYRLNQETDMQRVLTFFTYLADISLMPNSQKLFTTNDYKAIIDVLLRHVENCDEVDTMASLMELYLILSLNPSIACQGRYYELDRMLLAGRGFKQKNNLVLQLLSELQKMQMQQS